MRSKKVKRGTGATDSSKTDTGSRQRAQFLMLRGEKEAVEPARATIYRSTFCGRLSKLQVESTDIEKGKVVGLRSRVKYN